MEFILCVSVMDEVDKVDEGGKVDKVGEVNEVDEVGATHWVVIDGLWSRTDPDLILISPAEILPEGHPQQF